MKKILTQILILLIATSSYAQIEINKTKLKKVEVKYDSTNHITWISSLKAYTFSDQKPWRGYVRIYFGLSKENGRIKSTPIQIAINYTSYLKSKEKIYIYENIRIKITPYFVNDTSRVFFKLINTKENDSIHFNNNETENNIVAFTQSSAFNFVQNIIREPKAKITFIYTDIIAHKKVITAQSLPGTKNLKKYFIPLVKVYNSIIDEFNISNKKYIH